MFYFCKKYWEKIGGEHICVHVDETPLTTHKNGVGSISSSNIVWVIGAVDIEKRMCCLEFLPSRSTNDVKKFIDKNIEIGSNVSTDCLASYNFLNKIGINHFRVNHSKRFKEYDGTNTSSLMCYIAVEGGL